MVGARGGNGGELGRQNISIRDEHLMGVGELSSRREKDLGAEKVCDCPHSNKRESTIEA